MPELATESMQGVLGALDPMTVNYMTESPDAAAVCAKCCYFLAGAAPLCRQVAGEVAPLGSCALFKAREGEGDETEDDVLTMAAPEAPMMDESTQPAGPTHAALLVESLDLSEASVDHAAHTLRDVVLIRAGMSKNRRYYGASALEKARPIFEGSRAYANHPNKTEAREGRSIRDLTGWYENVRFVDGALRADRHFFTTQAGNDVWAIAEAIIDGKAPAHVAGLSINAVGTGKTRTFADGEALEVESITHALSVDDVDTPAAGGGYALTASTGDTLARELMQVMSFEEWTEAQPEYIKRLQKQWQKVRLDESTKAAITEADRKVKTAEAAAGESEQARLQLQEQYGALVEANRALLTRLETVSRALAVERALERVKLPASYKKDLRDELPKLAESEWENKIEREIAKAKAANALPRVDVHGAGAQVTAVLPVTESTDPAPRDNESVADWMARMNRINTKRN